MKKFKFILTLAVGVLLMLPSCNKENSNNQLVDGKDLSVRLKLNFTGSDAATKAVGGKIKNDDSLTFTSGHIFFTDDDGYIHKHVGIENSHGSFQILEADIHPTDGVVIPAIPNVVKNCLIVMNDVQSKFFSNNGITGNREGENIATLLITPIPVSNINDGGGVNTVLIAGAEDIEITGETDDEYVAETDVVVVAWTSRFQIGQFSAGVYSYTDANGDPQTVTIKSFKVEGVYTNNFASKFSFTADADSIVPTPAELVDSGESIENYSADADNYKAGGPGEKLHDQFPGLTGEPTGDWEDPANDPLVLLPEADPNKVWAYNLFPGGDVPHFVIKLTDVEYVDSANPTVTNTLPTQFITVQGFKYAAGHQYAGGDVDAIYPNQIYTLKDIKFDYSHLTVIPYQKNITASITVTLMPWGDNEIVWTP